MGLISLSPEEVAAVRQGFQQIINEFENQLNQTVTGADSLASTWKGVSYDAFVQTMQIWKAGVQQVGVEGLNDICNGLTTAGSTFTELDTELRGVFSGLGG